jgi:hypothetical protein
MAAEPLSVIAVVFEEPWFWQQNQALAARLNPDGSGSIAASRRCISW